MPHKHLHHEHKHKSLPVDSSILARESMGKRRSIESLRNKHKGTEIWILGTGPSMDDYPDDFFDDKISIGTKGNFKAFPNCTHFISSVGYRKAKNFLQREPKFFKKFILTLRVNPPRPSDWVSRKYRKYPVYMWGNWVNVRRPHNAALIPEAIKRIMKKQPSSYPHDDSITHLAIQAAAIMGAKKITLVGCEDKGFYAERYRGFYSSNRFGPNVPAIRLKTKWKSGIRHRKANRMFAKALKHYKIQLALYHHKDSKQYKTGYLKLV